MALNLVPASSDENKGPHILAASVTITVLALLTVCARIFTRVKVVRYVGPDDYAACAAMALSLIALALVIAQVHFGAGQHTTALSAAVFHTGMKLNFATQFMHIWAIATNQVSIAIFLSRITPIAISIITNILLGGLPTVMLWNVQMNRGSKFAVMVIMGLGIFVCGAAGVRVFFLSIYGTRHDYLWESSGLTISTTIECNCGIIAAAIPPIKPLFRNFFVIKWPSKSEGRKVSWPLHNAGRAGHMHLSSSVLRSPPSSKKMARVTVVERHDYQSSSSVNSAEAGMWYSAWHGDDNEDLPEWRTEDQF
ncbi:MAG: hypothetical protein M1838_003338 [Thelocarpon superellum]|nr:MAG: hypothetical protein M1838_003338 [Thelocarpon superellum]